jgi:uncharacterized protein YndB with AHSA1/START domain
MSLNAEPNGRLLGRLHSENGRGALRMENRVAASVDDVWSAITDPARLSRWYGVVEGDLRPGGVYTARVHASGWEGTGRVETCEPSRRLVLRAAEPGQSEHRTEVTLTADGDATVVVWDVHGLPLEYIAAFGAGIQVHIEDLAAYLVGGERCDSDARMDELMPAYADVAPK